MEFFDIDTEHRIISRPGAAQSNVIEYLDRGVSQGASPFYSERMLRNCLREAGQSRCNVCGEFRTSGPGQDPFSLECARECFIISHRRSFHRSVFARAFPLFNQKSMLWLSSNVNDLKCLN